jgi:hypothetical protein
MNFPRLVLINNLKKELRYEKSIQKVPEYFKDFIRKHGLVEQTSEDSDSLQIFKRVEDLTMEILVPFRPPLPEIKKKVYDNEILDLLEDKEGTEILKKDACQFFITVEKEKEFCNIECFTYESNIWLQDLKFTNFKPKCMFSLFRPIEKNINYNTLNEDLQQSIVDWLQSLGLTEDFGKYIEIRSLYREKELYANWLSKIISSLNDSS